jgi:hypothetical protein
MPAVLDPRRPVFVCNRHKIARRKRGWTIRTYTKAMEQRHTLRLIEADNCPYCLVLASALMDVQFGRRYGRVHHPAQVAFQTPQTAA